MRVVRAMVGLAIVLGVSGCSGPKPLVVACTMDKDHVDMVALDARTGHATLLSVSPALTGTVHATPTEYEAVFQPGPEGVARLVIKINRYTLRATREAGARSSETGATMSGSMTGTCVRSKAKPL